MQKYSEHTVPSTQKGARHQFLKRCQAPIFIMTKQQFDIKRIILFIIGVIFLIIGIITFPLPIPVGAIFIIISLLFLISSSPKVAKKIKEFRQKHPDVDKKVQKVEEWLPLSAQREIDKTDP